MPLESEGSYEIEKPKDTEADEEKELVNGAYQEAYVKMKKNWDVDFTARELIYLHTAAKEAVSVDKSYRDELKEMEIKGIKPEDMEYHIMRDVKRPILYMETIYIWLEIYLGIEHQEYPTAIRDVKVHPYDTDATPKERKWEYKDIGSSPSEQAGAYSIARRTRALYGNKRDLNEYYVRGNVLYDPEFKKYIKLKQEKRRAESEVSDLPETN